MTLSFQFNHAMQQGAAIVLSLPRVKKDNLQEMNDKVTLAVSGYAPPPEGSAATYGLVSTALVFVILWGLARFYDIALISHLAFVGVSLILAVVFGVWLRNKRKHRHHQAFDAERIRSSSPHCRHRLIS